MNLNPFAKVFVPSGTKDLPTNQSNISQFQQDTFQGYDNFSNQNSSESETGNQSYSHYSHVLEEDDFDMRPSTFLINVAKSEASSIFVKKYIVPRENIFNLYFTDLLKSLENDFSTLNINFRINKIADDDNLTFLEKRYLLGRITSFVGEKAKNSSEQVDIYDIIENLIYNKNISFRINKFLEEISKIGIFSEFHFAEIVHTIIEMERFDHVTIDITLLWLKKFTFNLEILNDLMRFSIEKLRKKTIKNVKKFHEFLEIITGNFIFNINPSPDSLKNFIVNDLELYYMDFNIARTLFIGAKFTNRDRSELEKLCFL